MSEQETCKNCGNHFSGKFCNNCGEKVRSEHDRSLHHILEEGVHFVTHLDGTLFTTIKAIFTKPGQLSLDYCNGIRKKYFKPLSFFLLLVILYLLFPLFEGLNMKLYFHQHHSFYGKFAAEKIAAVMEQKQLTFLQLSDAFHHTGEKTSKFLLFIIIPFLALVSWLFSFKKRKFYFDNFIFTVEVCSFFLLWGFLILPLLVQIYMWIAGSYPFRSEWITGLLIISIFGVYVARAARRFFSFRWWYSFLYAVLFSVALVAFLEYIYKFILFNIAINLVK